MRRLTTFALACVALAACGGGDDRPAPPPATTVPAPAPSTSLPAPAGATTAPAASAPATSAATAPSVATTTTLPPLQSLQYRHVASVEFPILITARPGDEVALLAQRAGLVRQLLPDGPGDPVMDLSDRVRTGGERGLLGLVRHPSDDSRLFAHYSDAEGATVIAEYRLSGLVADPDGERVLLRVPQPAANHNGGMIQFGPDGALYLGLGDGGGAGDPFRHGQNRESLLGGIVRIDVDTGESELWHYGLRNPWRFWIDGDDIWIADVGQNAYEEVDLADVTVPDLNYGWPIMEANHCYARTPCDSTGLVLPLVEIRRGDGGSCSITGGVVYRGGAIPELSGRFLFSDYCGGYLRSVDGEGTVVDHTEDVGDAGRVVSFGVDGEGEVYVLSVDEIRRLEAVR